MLLTIEISLNLYKISITWVTWNKKEEHALEMRIRKEVK